MKILPIVIGIAFILGPLHKPACLEICPNNLKNRDLDNAKDPKVGVFNEETEWDENAALSESIFLNQHIPSLKKNNYLEKKTKLIQQAKQAWLYSLNITNLDLQRICNPLREGRIISPSLGIYKRGLRHIDREALVWELSVLLGCDAFIAPSFPMEIHNKLSTFQPYIDAKNLQKLLLPNSLIDIQISQPDFWMTSIFIFLIGHADLNGTNLHYNENGFIFLDNDCAFPDRMDPFLNDDGLLAVPMQNFLLDLNLANIPLNFEDCAIVKSFLRMIQSSQNDLMAFLTLSSLTKTLPDLNKNIFLERLKRLTQIEVVEGMTHWDFARAVFPEHYENSEKVCEMIQWELGYMLGPSSSLCLIGPGFKDAGFTNEQKQRIKEWITLNYSH